MNTQSKLLGGSTDISGADETRVEMMLPPGIDGKQHTAFDTAVGVGTPYYWDGVDAILIRDFEANQIKPVAASAIANYWDDYVGHSPTPRVKFAIKQRAIWKRAARGEVIENAVIVPLKWEE